MPREEAYDMYSMYIAELGAGRAVMCSSLATVNGSPSCAVDVRSTQRADM